MCRAAVLALGLLVALLYGGAQATDGLPMYGVKLCGREFIRAVIFTCGGSRWRRSLDVSGEIKKAEVLFICSFQYNSQLEEPTFCFIDDASFSLPSYSNT